MDEKTQSQIEEMLAAYALTSPTNIVGGTS